MNGQLQTWLIALGFGMGAGQGNERPPTPPAKADSVVQFLLQGMQAHLERFPFVQARWRYLQYARAATVEDALAGRWLDDPAPAVAQVYWAFAHERFRMDKIYDEETLKRFERRQGNYVVRSLVSRRYFGNRSLVIIDEPGQIFRFDRREISYGWYPFCGGKAFPLYEMPERLGGAFEYLGEQVLNGRPLPVLRYRPKTKDGAEDAPAQKPGEPRRFWIPNQKPTLYSVDDCFIDPDRGFTSVRLITRWGPIGTKADDLPNVNIYDVQELRDLGDGRWLPWLVRYVNLADNPPRGYEVKVEEIDVANPPADEVFDLQRPPGSKGYDHIHDGWIFTETGRVSLAEFRSDGTLVDGSKSLRWEPLNSVRRDWVPPTNQPAVPVWPFVSIEETNPAWLWLIPLTAVALILLLVTGRWAVRKRWRRLKEA